MTAEELLMSDEVEVFQYSNVIEIDGQSRVISVPLGEDMFGVEGDKDVTLKHFTCPKIVGNNIEIDLSEHNLYANYTLADEKGNPKSEDVIQSPCENIVIGDDYISFDWKISEWVTKEDGYIAFSIVAKKSVDGVLETRWYTTPAVGRVLKTVKEGRHIEQQYPDVIDNLMNRVSDLERILANGGGNGGSIVVDDALSETSSNPVQNKVVTKEIRQLSKEKVDNPSTGAVGQILEIATVDENGKPKTYKAVDKPTGGEGVVVDVQPQWAEFPRATNPARDIYNSVAMTNKKTLGTDGTLRHNLMIDGNSTNSQLITWTESTGNVDYADSSGAASVKLMGWYDYYGNGSSVENPNIAYSQVYDVFPSGADIYGVDGTVIDTVVASSDNAIIPLGNNDYIIMAGCMGVSKYHMVYRTVSYGRNVSMTFGDTIHVLTINGAEWDMLTLREDYHKKHSQVNTKVIKYNNLYYMAIVQDGIGIAIVKSSDGKDWTLHHHIPDSDCHLEACIGMVSYVSNKMPTVYVVVRNGYGHGYITLYAFDGLSEMSMKHKIFIPASSGRAMIDTWNNKDIYLAYSVNGRKNAVLAQILPNSDGTTGISILETPREIMSNYPVLFCDKNITNVKTIMFGGTDGLNKNGSSVSVAWLWNENTAVLNEKNEQLKKVMFGTSVEVVQTLTEGTEIGSVGGTKLYAPSASSGGGTPTLQLLGSTTVSENTGSVDFEFSSALKLKKLLVYANTIGVSDFNAQARGNVYINGKNVADGQDNNSFNAGAKKYMLFEIDILSDRTIGKMYLQGNMGGGYSSEKVAFVTSTNINSNTDITKISFKANTFDGVGIATGTTVSVYGY